MKDYISIKIENPFKYGFFPWEEHTEFITKVKNTLFLTKKEFRNVKRKKIKKP